LVLDGVIGLVVDITKIPSPSFPDKDGGRCAEYPIQDLDAFRLVSLLRAVVGRSRHAYLTAQGSPTHIRETEPRDTTDLLQVRLGYSFRSRDSA
jgi:hypothetical protein